MILSIVICQATRESLLVLNILRKYIKTEFHGGHLGMTMGTFQPCTLYMVTIILRYIINRGDNLKNKQAYKKMWAFFGTKYSCEFLPLMC